MLVRTNAVAVGLLTKVHGVVLVPHNGMDDFTSLALQRGQRRGARVLVLHGHQRDGNTRHTSHAGPPDAGADKHHFGGYAACRCFHPMHPPALTMMSVTVVFP